MAKTPSAVPKAPPAPPLPESVTLSSVFGFYDEAGVMRLWPEGHVETDPQHISTLISRKAPLKD